MCLFPISIKNPNFHKLSYASEKGRGVAIARHLTPTDEYIEVLCNKCIECKQTYYNSILQRALVEARSSYLYFVTLTYNNAHLPILHLPTGEDFYYVDYVDVQNLFKRLRNHKVIDRDFRYLVVNEYGDTYGRPHVHFILFVARSADDDETTPYNIEDTLKRNIIRYWAKNIGTKKHPKYEMLCTPRTRVTSKGIKTNYFVKYVNPKDYSNLMSDDVNACYTKTIRYLISYVNNGVKIDTYLQKMLTDYQHDSILISKLTKLLQSRLRYSKGFGCGFDNGCKQYLPRISVKCSGFTLLYSDFIDSLPPTEEEYVEMYGPLLYTMPYYRFDNITDFTNNLDTAELLNWIALLKYRPKFVQYIKDTYWREPLKPTISYLYSCMCVPIIYKRQLVRTNHPNECEVFLYLRDGVEQGISSHVPYLSFVNKVDGTFIALCKYYRERVCTIEDTQRMYDSIKVENWQEWKSKFTNQRNLQKVAKTHGNVAKHEKEALNIFKSQKKYIHLSQKTTDTEFYRKIFRLQ